MQVIPLDHPGQRTQIQVGEAQLPGRLHHRTQGGLVGRAGRRVRLRQPVAQHRGRLQPVLLHPGRGREQEISALSGHAHLARRRQFHQGQEERLVPHHIRGTH